MRDEYWMDVVFGCLIPGVGDYVMCLIFCGVPHSPLVITIELHYPIPFYKTVLVYLASEKEC